MISIFTWYFLSFRGRISRNEFWLGYMGLLAICGLLTQLLLYLAFHHPTGRLWDRHELGRALSMPFIIAVAILLWPFISIFVKRLHDLNISGWWLVAAAAMPFGDSRHQLLHAPADRGYRAGQSSGTARKQSVRRPSARASWVNVTRD
jgi:uncharacterized membrane protein YhaH (DUF805 family)